VRSREFELSTHPLKQVPLSLIFCKMWQQFGHRLVPVVTAPCSTTQTTRRRATVGTPLMAQNWLWSGGSANTHDPVLPIGQQVFWQGILDIGGSLT